MSTEPVTSSDTSKTKHVYKILPSAPPTPLPQTLPLSTLDANDGFIHLSTSTQVPGTASRFFGEYEKLWVLKMRVEVLQKTGTGRVVWEEAKGVGVFPHLYDGDLGSGVVDEVMVVERGEGWEGALGSLEV